MKQTVHRGYLVTAVSREDPPGEWRSRWSAKRIGESEAHFESWKTVGAYLTESEADEAGLLAGCDWVDKYGRF